MPRRDTEDTPPYAADAIAAAQANGSQLAASGGLFIMLLIAMSLIEAPIPRWDGPVHRPDDRESTLLVGSPSAYRSANTPGAQVGAEPSSMTAVDGAPWCREARSIAVTRDAHLESRWRNASTS